MAIMHNNSGVNGVSAVNALVPYQSVPIEDLTVSDLVTMLSSQEITAPLDRRPQVTVQIHVPTSEHVAQIVGKSGQKIKNLRSLTNTCIKTPLRGDDPVFTVTGVRENVEKASQAIEFASQHFTALMNSRSNSCAVGEKTILVPVPTQYVGVVVGRNGSVIMKIKEQTNTRINTPKGDANAAAFEVTGSQVNVLAAKEAIEEKVRQAYELRNSSMFDPNLNQSKFFNKAIGMPSPQQQPDSTSLARWSDPNRADFSSNSMGANSMGPSISPFADLRRMAPPMSPLALPMHSPIFDPNYHFMQM